MFWLNNNLHQNKTQLRELERKELQGKVKEFALLKGFRSNVVLKSKTNFPVFALLQNFRLNFPFKHNDWLDETNEFSTIIRTKNSFCWQRNLT